MKACTHIPHSGIFIMNSHPFHKHFWLALEQNIFWSCSVSRHIGIWPPISTVKLLDLAGVINPNELLRINPDSWFGHKKSKRDKTNHEVKDVQTFTDTPKIWIITHLFSVLRRSHQSISPMRRYRTHVLVHFIWREHNLLPLISHWTTSW